MPKLHEKYRKNYSREMGTFEFEWKDITFDIMEDFNYWNHEVADFGDGTKYIIFYLED